MGVCDVAVLSANGRWWCALVSSFILLRCGANDRSEARPSSGPCDNSQVSQSAVPTTHQQWTYEYESGSDSDADRPDPDVVMDDLASRRFHSPSPAPPTNFAVPVSTLATGKVPGGRGGPSNKVTMSLSVPPPQNVTSLRSENMKHQLDFDVLAWCEPTRMLICSQFALSNKSSVCWLPFELYEFVAVARFHLLLMDFMSWLYLAANIIDQCSSPFIVWL